MIASKMLVVGAAALLAATGLRSSGSAVAPAAESSHPARDNEAGKTQLQLAAAIGRRIFSDASLSEPPGQSCVSCHRPDTGFADPRPVSPGAAPGRMGRRNAPSLMYAALIPSLVYEDTFTPDGLEVYAWEGGLFQDGHARDLFEQAREPLFRPDEMNLPNHAALAKRLRAAKYADDLRAWVGQDNWADDERLNYHAFRALVRFLQEPMFRPFDARIDDYLGGDRKALNEAETRGLAVFRGAGKCADCHLLEPTNWPQPLLSDFGYDNLGVPSRGVKDPGLKGTTSDPETLGQFRAPTLRNVELTAPYMHNGSVATLREVMEFYNKRDVEPNRWEATDYPETVNHENMGNLGLAEQDIDDLLALMSAFTDRSLLELRKRNLDFPIAPPSAPPTDELLLFFPDWTYRYDLSFPHDAENRRDQ